MRIVPTTAILRSAAQMCAVAIVVLIVALISAYCVEPELAMINWPIPSSGLNLNYWRWSDSILGVGLVLAGILFVLCLIGWRAACTKALFGSTRHRIVVFVAWLAITTLFCVGLLGLDAKTIEGQIILLVGSEQSGEWPATSCAELTGWMSTMRLPVSPLDASILSLGVSHAYERGCIDKSKFLAVMKTLHEQASNTEWIWIVTPGRRQVRLAELNSLRVSRAGMCLTDMLFINNAAVGEAVKACESAPNGYMIAE